MLDRPQAPMRSRRGLSLVEAALASTLIIIALYSFLNIWSNYIFRQALQGEARDVSALAAAAKTHLLHNFDSQIAAARLNANNVIVLSIDDLITSESYSPAAARQSMRGRDLVVYLWAPDANTALILAAARFGTGEVGRVGVPRGGKDIHAVGWVAPHNTTQIQGPGVRLDITALQAPATPLASGDLVALEYVSYGRDISPYLHRAANALRPELNQMKTDLHLGGNDIVGVGSLTASDITIDASFAAGQITGVTNVQGPVNVTGNLTVTGTTTITGDTTLTGALRAASVTVAQTLTTSNVTATTATFDILTSNQVNAAAVTVSGQVTTPLLTGTTITADVVKANRVEAVLGILDGVTQADAVVAQTVITGGCSGC